MVNKNSAYWSARRTKTGGKFVRNVGGALVNPTVANVAAAAWSGVKAIRALINVESFQLDTSYGITTVANVAQITPLNNMAQGDGQSQRTGNSILMKKLHRTEYCTSSAANVIIREILFYDKQQVSDTAPVVTDLLESSTPLALYNKLSKSRFQILEDKLYTLNSVSKTNRIIRNTKMLNKHAIYNGAASTDIQKMGIYKLVIADGVVGFGGAYRLFYIDN